MTRYIYAFLLLLCVVQNTNAQEEVLILTVNGSAEDDRHFENFQSLFGATNTISICDVSIGPATNIPPTTCMADLASYDLVMVQGLYSSFTEAFIDRLILYLQGGGNLFFEIDPATISSPGLENLQEDNINRLLAGIGQASINLQAHNESITDSSPSILIDGKLSTCIAERVSFSTGGEMVGPALDNAVTLAIGLEVYQAYWDTGFGGRLGVAAEYYTAGHPLPSGESNVGAAQMVWNFMQGVPDCVVSKSCLGQEMVSNPDFETFDTCPDNSGQVIRSTDWRAPVVLPSGSNGSEAPDYFNSCAPFILGTDYVGTTANYKGGLNPFSGEAYAGIHTYITGGPSNKEYLVTELSTPLIAGREYQISFVYSLAKSSSFASDALGMYLGATEPNTYASVNNHLTANPQLVTPAGVFIDNKASWSLAAATYTATGGERFVVIGTFHDNVPEQIGVTSFGGAYYYIDAVSVRERQGNATLNAGEDSTIASGGSTVLMPTATGGTPISYSWSPVDGLDDTSSANPIASPNETTTYTVTADFGGGCSSSDSVTVMVDELESNGFQSCSGINNNWYFGLNAGLSFNNGTVTAITDGQLSTDEGTAAISDNNGALLFYTDGIRVYDRNGNIMPNGSDLKGGNSSAQSAIILQKPGTTDRYLIFTSEEAGNFNGLQYSEIDMELNGGMGDVTTVKNVQLVEKITEKLIAVPHANGTDTWIIVHRWQSNEFLSFLLSPSGVDSGPTISAVGETLNILGKYGTMKVNSDATRIANSSIDTGNVQLFDFNAGTGRLSNPQTLSDMLKPYGIEFSANNRFLYVGESGKAADGSRLFQYDLNAGTIDEIQGSQTVLSNTPRSGGALQIGPDGRIYHSVFNQTSLGVIANPNLLGMAADYQQDAIDLGGNLAKLGLPPSVLCSTSCTEIVLNDAEVQISIPNCTETNGFITNIDIQGTTETTIYQWSDENNTIVGTSPDLLNVAAGRYTLLVSDTACENSIGPFDLQCDRSADLELPVTIANTMTPNGDGANDTFYIQGIEAYPNNQLIIYNRWGNKVYESAPYRNDWYGTAKGKKLPVAVYYYQLLLGQQRPEPINGYISILK